MNLSVPFPYQVDGSRWLATMPQALLADTMGLGKSAQAVIAADLVGARSILVICPSNLRVNWSREFVRFSPFDRRCAVLFATKDRFTPQDQVVICSYEWATANAHLLKARQWDVLILDEAHYLKERGAKRTKAVYGRGSRFPGIAASSARVWRLTGTPAPNNASELYPHLKSAGVTTDPYWDFTFRYCAGFDSSYGYKITGHKNTEELKGLLAKFMLRRTKEEVLKDLPPIRFQEVTVARGDVELDPTFYEQIQKLGSEQAVINDITVSGQTLSAALAKASQPVDLATNQFRLGVLEALAPSMITLRRYIGMAKLGACLDIIEEELKSGALEKIVIFGVHQCVIEGTRARLAKYGAVSIYGKTPPEKRQRHVDRFMKDKHCRVFVGNIQAAGVGVTLTSAHEVAFLEQSWVPAENAQAAMRCHRIGQAHPVRVRVFSLEGGVDELVTHTLLRKSRELTKIDL